MVFWTVFNVFFVENHCFACVSFEISTCFLGLLGLEECGEGSVAHGTNCSARCRLPYNSTVTTAYCPEEIATKTSHLKRQFH